MGSVIENRKKFIRDNNNRCLECRIVGRSIGYYDKYKEFIECDEFMFNWAKENNLRPFTVELVITNRVGKAIDDPGSDSVLLCRHCHLSRIAHYGKLRQKLKGIIYPKRKRSWKK